MAITIDSEEWLENLCDDIEGKYNLYDCITKEKQIGAFIYERKNGNVLVTNGKQNLVLVSQKQVDDFLEKLNVTTDVEEWLEHLDDESKHIEEINNLYNSITEKAQLGCFNCDERNNKLFVTNEDSEQVLILVSEKDITDFLDKLDKEYGKDYGSVASHYEYARSMGKDD